MIDFINRYTRIIDAFQLKMRIFMLFNNNIVCVYYAYELKRDISSRIYYVTYEYLRK